MRFSGMEKVSLVDYDGYTACTVFTAGCNMRCPFCQNAALLGPASLTISEDEVIDYLQRRTNLIDALCITGGEPTLWQDLPDFIRRVRRALPHLRVKLDTNGTNPDMLKVLLDEALLEYVAMDIKNCKEKYESTAGAPVDLDKIERSLSLLSEKEDPNFSFELRTTVVAELHTEQDMHDIGVWLKDTPRFFLQMFRDRGTNLTEGLHAHSDETLIRFGEILRKYIPSVTVRGLF